MEDMDLNIENYDLNDLLSLFKLDFDFHGEDLKRAKKSVMQSHPDKSGLDKKYFLFFSSAYKIIFSIYDFRHKSSKTQSTEYTVEKDEAKEILLKKMQSQPNFNKVFNQLFEKHKINDEENETGYGDWLKSSDSNASGPKFKGEFNRDVFNRMFDEESRKGGKQSTNLIVHPGQMALTLNPTSGVDLVGERPDSYTAAPNSKFQFTDLRGAYTSDSTISDKVSNVQVGDRNFEQYRASREKAPDPFNQSELHGIQEYERRQQSMDVLRERKRAEMNVRNQQYHDRMKQMVITDGVDLNQKKLGY